MTSVYLVSDPRMTLHRPVQPPEGQEQHRQLDPPCERPERIVRIMERLQELEHVLVGFRRNSDANNDRKNVAAGKLQGDGGMEGTPMPFVRSTCSPVSRETVTLLHPGEYYDKLRATSTLSDGVLHQLTVDTLSGDDVYYHNDTFLAATLACGGVVGCIDSVLGGAGMTVAKHHQIPQAQGYSSGSGTVSDNEDLGNESPRDVASFPDGNSSDNGNGGGSGGGSGSGSGNAITSNNTTATPIRPENSASRALAIVRPPGHHACQSRSMGFCFLNSVAVAAKYALTQHSSKCQRVLILDWDVHHGNGTQDLTYDDPNILYVSLHRIAKQGSKLYFFPGTGRPDEVGHDAAEGANLNVAWDIRGVGNVEYAAAFSELILPLVSAFDPSLVMISCGFDAAEGDLIGDCLLSPEMYYRMTRSLLATAGISVPTVVALEGGYNLDVITDCAEAVALALLDEPWAHRVELTRSSAFEVAASEGNDSHTKLRERNEVFGSSIDSSNIDMVKDMSIRSVDMVKDMSIRSIGELQEDPSCASFNASTIMESVRQIISDDQSGAGDDGEGNGDGDGDCDSSSTSSLDIHSSLRHLKAVEGDDPGSISGGLALPSPIISPPQLTAEERLRAGRTELSSFWNYDSPSARMKGMGAKKSAIRCINQSIRAIRNTSRWRDGTRLRTKEIPNQNEFVPLVSTRNRRNAAMAAQSVEDMNASLGNVSMR
eukprot:CAMPEP_0178490926 /NCGR_PEP_ID=MMETSP0696-20121128/11142_1 /TAXON_ID=265572 /ORGANISM="Extubocellulus spinifer, Strain CCMP396" /LENGTH=712 /DNA_ID=CAMNT_0020118771 /DNA_START=149 /DNA_END=2287 /DNA_ORIENTATION=-